jgi:hypothetical protein
MNQPAGDAAPGRWIVLWGRFIPQTGRRYGKSRRAKRVAGGRATTYRVLSVKSFLAVGNNLDLLQRTSIHCGTGGKEVILMHIKARMGILFFTLALMPALAFAQEKNGTIQAYDSSSRMVTVKGKDWEQKAKVSSKDAEAQKDLLKEGAKVKVEFDDRGGGDVRVKSISGR